MAFFKSKKEKNGVTGEKDYREGKQANALLNGRTFSVTVLKVFQKTAIVRTQDGLCTTCNLSDIHFREG